MKRKKTDADRELGREIEECIEPGCSIKKQIDTMLAYGPMDLGLNKANRENEAEKRVENEVERKA